MKSVVAHAIGYCAVLVVAAGAAYLWWFHVAARPVITGPSVETIERIKSSQDIEQLRRTALLLANARIESGKVVDEILTDAVVVIIIACIAGALAVAFVTLRALRTFREASGQHLGWLRYTRWL